VGDFRNKSKYHMFHADLAHAMEKRGFGLKGLTILHQRHKRIFPWALWKTVVLAGLLATDGSLSHFGGKPFDVLFLPCGL
jgi:hypothetical protein